jgi:DNA-binding NarL/FixJ family response regulator
MSRVRIVLEDDHTLVRAGLRKLLESVDGFEVVAEYTHGRDVLRGVRETTPDVVVMDIAMPELNGLDATARERRGRLLRLRPYIPLARRVKSRNTHCYNPLSQSVSRSAR